MRKKFIKIAIFILATLQLASCLVGCRNGEETDTTDTVASEFALTVENLANYVIVVNDSKTAKLSNVISTLQGHIKKITGESPEMKSDFIAEGSDVYCESEFEILLGCTARDEDVELYSTLRNRDTGYAFVNKKIIIIGETESTAEASVRLFFSDVLYGAAE